MLPGVLVVCISRGRRRSLGIVRRSRRKARAKFDSQSSSCGRRVVQMGPGKAVNTFWASKTLRHQNLRMFQRGGYLTQEQGQRLRRVEKRISGTPGTQRCETVCGSQCLLLSSSLGMWNNLRGNYSVTDQRMT